MDSYIAELLEAKMALIAAVEAEDVPERSLLKEVEAKLRSLAPALMEEARLASKPPDVGGHLNRISELYPKIVKHASQSSDRAQIFGLNGRPHLAVC